MNLSDVVVGLIRTAVPAGVAALLVWASKALGVDVTGLVSTEVAVAAVTAAYWSLVNLAVKYSGWEWLGWLLGYPQQPTYTKPAE